MPNYLPAILGYHATYKVGDKLLDATFPDYVARNEFLVNLGKALSSPPATVREIASALDDPKAVADLRRKGFKVMEDPGDEFVDGEFELDETIPH